MNSLENQVALVTGGSRGIGRAVALALARAGADVAVNYRSAAKQADEVVSQIHALGRRAVAIQADVSKSSEVNRLAVEVESGLGTVTIVVNNAGIARPQALADVTEADWDDILDVNLKSAFLVTQRFLAGMRARRFGRIVFMSSVAAQVGGIVGPHYAASKAGMIGLMHSYAALLAKEGITANAIAPALVRTDMVDANPNAKPDKIPMGFFGDVEDVAQAVVMIARNSYMTGQTINLNGGWYIS